MLVREIVENLRDDRVAAAGALLAGWPVRNGVGTGTLSRRCLMGCQKFACRVSCSDDERQP
jgi:hypothetical protein